MTSTTTTKVCVPVDLDELDDDMEKVMEDECVAKQPVDLNELEEQKKSTMDHNTTTSVGMPLAAWVVPMGIAADDGGEKNSVVAQQLQKQQQPEQERPQVTRTIVQREFTSIEELMRYMNSLPEHRAVGAVTTREDFAMATSPRDNNNTKQRTEELRQQRNLPDPHSSSTRTPNNMMMSDRDQRKLVEARLAARRAVAQEDIEAQVNCCLKICCFLVIVAIAVGFRMLKVFIHNKANEEE